MTRQQDHSTFANAILAVFPSGPKYEAWRNYLTGLDEDDLVDLPKMYATLRTMERNHVGPFNIAHFHTAYITTIANTNNRPRPDFIGAGEFRHPGNHHDTCQCGGTGWTHKTETSPVTGKPTEYAHTCPLDGTQPGDTPITPEHGKDIARQAYMADCANRGIDPNMAHFDAVLYGLQTV